MKRIVAGLAVFLFSVTSAIASLPPTEPPPIDVHPAHGAYKMDDRVDGEMAEKFSDWVDAELAAGHKTLDIEINSGGGSVFDGLEIAKKIERAGVVSYCTVDGMAASMAFFILQSCTFRRMTKRSVLMAHEPAGYVSGGGQQGVFSNLKEFLRVLTRAMAEHCAARMNISVERYMELTAGGKELWMSQTEASELGAVDLVLSDVPRK